MSTEPRVYPVAVSARPDGANLEIAPSHYEDFLKDVFALLAENGTLRDDLLDLIDGPVITNDPHIVDRPSRDDVLAEAIVAALPAASTTIRLHRNPLAALTDQLTTLVGRRTWPLRQGRRAA
jgi:hypothetical protein